MPNETHADLFATVRVVSEAPLIALVHRAENRCNYVTLTQLLPRLPGYLLAYDALSDRSQQRH